MLDHTNNSSYLIDSYEGNLFLSSKYKQGDKFVSDIGLVFSYFKEDKTNESYTNLEPRLNFSYMINDDFSIKLAYIFMHQYIHILSPYNNSLPNDVFYPSAKSLPPMSGSQLSAGVSKIMNLWESEYDLSADIYYNDMKKVPDIKNHFQNADPFALSDQILIGKGWSYGVEMQIAKNEGKLSGWLNYTWNAAKRLFPGKNKDKAYDAKFNKTHQMNLVLNYSLSESVKLGATYVLSTGQPMTLAVQKYYIDNRPYVDYGEINGYRMPYYSRLDVNIVHFFNMWGGKWELLGSVYNLLMRKNPTFISYGAQDYEIFKVSLGLVPTVGLKFHY